MIISTLFDFVLLFLSLLYCHYNYTVLYYTVRKVITINNYCFKMEPKPVITS